MTKSDLLKHIAETAYNVGYGAKKHFATYDIVEKAPGIINFLAISIGILALFIDELTTKVISATLIILGIIGIYISQYNESKNRYSEKGSEITEILNHLKSLYYTVKSKPDNSDFESEIKEMKMLESSFYAKAISKQILFSDWYAHYKFFWQMQIGWINEQLQFNFWRDKVPLSAWLCILLIALGIGLAVVKA